MTISTMSTDNMVGQPANEDTCIDEFPSPVGTIKRVTIKNSCLYYCYANRGDFLYERFVGSGTLEDMAVHYGVVMSDQNRKAGLKVLIDHRSCLFDVSFNKMFELDRFVKSKYEKGNVKPSILVLLSNTDRGYGKTRMYESVAERGPKIVHPVRDVGQALDLLEIDAELLADVMAEIEKIAPADQQPGPIK